MPTDIFPLLTALHDFSARKRFLFPLLLLVRPVFLRDERDSKLKTQNHLNLYHLAIDDLVRIQLCGGLNKSVNRKCLRKKILRPVGRLIIYRVNEQE